MAMEILCNFFEVLRISVEYNNIQTFYSKYLKDVTIRGINYTVKIFTDTHPDYLL